MIRVMVCAIAAWLLLGNCSGFGAAGGSNYSRGIAALRSGDYDDARKCFESGLKDKVNLEESQAGLLETLRETGAYPEAVRRSEEFLSSRKLSSLLHLERGRIAVAVGDYAVAEKHLQQARTLAPLETGVRMDATRDLAELLEEVGRRADAQYLWDQMIGEYRQGRIQGSRKLGDVAVAAWRRGYVQDAKDIFMDATDPKLGEISLKALADFGYLFLEKYNATEALGVFRDCLKINRFYPEALVGIALAKKYDSDFETETYARVALKVNPNLVPALNILAELAIESENREVALKHIHAALSVNQADLEALSLQAVCRYFSGDQAGFAEIEGKVLAINPSYGRLYYTLAENLVSRRKYQQAVDFNRKAVALDPELWAAYASLGMNLTRVGNLEEGRAAIQKAFEGDPFNVWAFNSLKLLDQMNKFVRTRSAHFIFLMSREDAPVLSPYAPELAEEAFTKLTRRYGFKPDGPIQIEIFPDHGGFAVRTLGLPGLGGALGVCFGRVVAIDSPRARESGTFNWGSTLWHEFVHVMTLQMSNYNIPRWYSEGLSVYEEIRARPGWGDNLTSAFVRAYKEGRLLKASELNAGIVRPQNPEQIMLSYYQAGLVCQWIEESFGFEKIRQSLLLFAENKTSEEVFRQTLGLDVAGMDAAYSKFIDARIKDLASHLEFAQTVETDAADAMRSPNKDAWTGRLQRDPSDFYANLNLGRLLLKEGANAEAEVYLKNAQRLFPQYVAQGNPYQLLGQLYLDLKRDEDALAEYVAWSRLDGTAMEPILKAAGIYRGRKDWASAAKMLALSVFIYPYDQDTLSQLGEAAMESGAWPEAIAAYKALMGLDPSEAAGAHFNLARALLAAGNGRESKREVLRALEIAPTFRRAQELLLRLSESETE
jgi:tetratricopeptide (TPR) repeat protein